MTSESRIWIWIVSQQGSVLEHHTDEELGKTTVSDQHLYNRCAAYSMNTGVDRIR